MVEFSHIAPAVVLADRSLNHLSVTNVGVGAPHLFVELSYEHFCFCIDHIIDILVLHFWLDLIIVLVVVIIVLVELLEIDGGSVSAHAINGRSGGRLNILEAVDGGRGV